MSVTVAGISTIGAKVGYAVDSTKPSSLTELERCNAIGGIELSTEQIDASALIDAVSRYIAGRADTGGTWELTFNLTDETQTILEAMLTAYAGRTSGQALWLEVTCPDMTDGFWVKAQPPAKIPMPEMAQNSLLTVTISFAIEEYIGLDTKVAF